MRFRVSDRPLRREFWFHMVRPDGKYHGSAWGESIDLFSASWCDEYDKNTVPVSRLELTLRGVLEGWNV